MAAHTDRGGAHLPLHCQDGDATLTPHPPPPTQEARTKELPETQQSGDSTPRCSDHSLTHWPQCLPHR